MDRRRRSGGGRTDEHPTLDALETLLASDRRRYVLRYLQRREAAATVEELADALAAHEADDADDVGPRERACIRGSLHHVHLPTLAAAGVVRYDRGAGRVAATGRVDDAAIDAFLPADVRVPTDPE